MGNIAFFSVIGNKSAKTPNRINLFDMVDIEDGRIFGFDGGLIENHIVVVNLE